MKLITSKVCKTSDIGVNENLFGGTLLAWLDESAAIMACDIVESKSMVTLKIDEVLFKQPVKVNDHIKIYGEVVKVGNSSITLKLEARRRIFFYGEYLQHKEKETVVCSTNIVFVQIDLNGNSCKFTETQRVNALQIQ